MKEKINVVSLATDSYFQGLFVTVLSIILSSKKKEDLIFFVIDGGISSENKNKLNYAVSNLSTSIDIKYIEPASEIFESFPAYKGNKLTYSRLFMPEILPEIDKVVFVDSDTLWLAPVEDIWVKISDEFAIVAREDPYQPTITEEKKWFEANQLKFDSSYFCAAIVGLNLSVMRQLKIIEKANYFINNYGTPLFAEQTILNFYLQKRIFLLESQYHLLTKIDNIYHLKSPFVLHYAGEIPWERKVKSKFISDAEMLWYEFYEKFDNINEINVFKSTINSAYYFKRFLFHLIPILVFVTRYLKSKHLFRIIANNNNQRISKKYYKEIINIIKNL